MFVEAVENFNTYPTKSTIFHTIRIQNTEESAVREFQMFHSVSDSNTCSFAGLHLLRCTDSPSLAGQSSMRF